jgi:hypothetical protein
LENCIGNLARQSDIVCHYAVLHISNLRVVPSPIEDLHTLRNAKAVVLISGEPTLPTIYRTILRPAQTLAAPILRPINYALYQRFHASSLAQRTLLPFLNIVHSHHDKSVSYGCSYYHI